MAVKSDNIPPEPDPFRENNMNVRIKKLHMKSKRFLILYIVFAGLLLSPRSAVAQSYAALWKSVEAARTKDLPKTALQSVDKVVSKARREGNSPQLLKALMVRRQLASDLSPDSAALCIPQLQKALQEERDTVMQSLYHTALGLLYAAADAHLDEQAPTQAVSHLKAAMARPELLAEARTSDFLPLVVEERDGTCFSRDLLNIIARFTGERLSSLNNDREGALDAARSVYAVALTQYRRHRNREAEFFLLLDSFQTISSYTPSVRRTGEEAFYRSLIRQFGDLDVCCEAYVRLARIADGNAVKYSVMNEGLNRYPKARRTNALKNLLTQLTQPRISVDVPAGPALPLREDSFRVQARHLSRAFLRFYRTDLKNTASVLRTMDRDALRKVPRRLACEVPVVMPESRPYEDVHQTVAFRAPEAGIYFVTLESGNLKSEAEVYYVSGLHLMQLPLKSDRVRIVVSDASTGKPLSGAKVLLSDAQQGHRVIQTLTTGEEGGAELNAVRNLRGQLFVQNGADAFCRPQTLSREYWNPTTERLSRHTALFTDRAIYRPAQKVKAGGFCYTKNGDSTAVEAGRTLRLALYDANHKMLDTLQVTSDALGAFSAEFTLPPACLNGMFSISSPNGSTSFRVEEYRRPTFTVTFDDVNEAYAAGDIVRLNGTVKTLAGFPLPATRVALNVTRSASPWFFWGRSGKRVMQTDTVQTDSAGRFTLPVKLDIDAGEEIQDLRLARFYIFTAEAAATAADGESETATYRLFAGNRPSVLSTSMLQKVCRESAASFVVYQKNAGGQPVAGRARFDLYNKGRKVESGEWTFNEPIQANFFQHLKSGEYLLKVNPAERTDTLLQLTHPFLLFSFDDKTAVGSELLQVNQSAGSFADSTVKVLVATPSDEAYIHYDLFDGANRLLESKVLKLSNESRLFTYTYRPEYGNGLMAVFAMVKEGKTSVSAVRMSKPEPDKKLSMRWKVFRDRLRPGQDETWVLQISRHGRPVEASVLATLYDASLDKFRKHSLPFSLFYNRNLPSKQWRYTASRRLYLACEQSLSLLREQDWAFSHLDEAVFTDYVPMRFTRLRGGRVLMAESKALGAVPMSAIAVNDVASAASEDVAATESVSNLKMAKQSAAVDVAEPAETASTSDSGASVSDADVRTNFEETAFFQPQLTTDRQGMVNVRFVLPQSLTQWNFLALAHTQDLAYAEIDTVAVAQKVFMVQPNLPRFLRHGDRTMLSASVRNATGEPVSGRAVLEVTDAETGERLTGQNVRFSVGGHAETVVAFPFTASAEHPLLVVKITAGSETFSDGEQRYVPVLDDAQLVTESIPLNLTGTGTQTVSLTSLFGGNYAAARRPRLTIEYTGNPVWMAIEALPTLSRPISENAVSMSSAYYALSLAALEAKADPELEVLARTWKQQGQVDSVYLLLERNADLKQMVLGETPWVAAADRERNRLQALSDLFDPTTLSYRRRSYLDKLLSLQTADGSWSWFPRMRGSLWMTAEVCETLMRLKRLGGFGDADEQRQAAGAVGRALTYMDREVKDLVTALKKKQQRTGRAPQIGGTVLRYLNVVALHGWQNTPDRTYLVSLLEKSARSYDMYDKALAACVLHAAGKRQAALLTLQSLMEHTVSTETMGRYFDSPRAPRSFDAYRVPAQVAAMEALSALTPQDTMTLQEMTRWLVQAKRTQTWDNPRSSVDAIYWLFLKQKLLSHSGGKAFPTMKLRLSDGREANLSATMPEIQQPLSLGYYRRTLEKSDMPAAPQSLTIEKKAAPMAFGAVHAQYVAPASAVKSLASGLSLSCSYSVKRAGQWQPVREDDALQKGDLVRIRYELTADRDYDFVCLKEGRPACCEPVQPLSGYDFRLGCYRAVGDASTQYFFNQMAKGRHAFETEMRIDRSGTFSSAAPTVQCVYAPEFGGRAENVTLQVK